MKKRRARKMRKALMMTCCALALVALSVGATLAYLTDTESVTNTFTVGKVGITLDEAKVNADGTVVTPAKRVNGNEYHLIPGHTYVKDPTVTMNADSENAYVRMLVTVEDYADFKQALITAGRDDLIVGDVILLQDMVEGWDASKWAFDSATPGTDTMVYEFRYSTVVAKGTGALEPLFTSFTLPGEIKNNPDNENQSGYIGSLDEMEINVVAHAIQADGFDDADEAWDAFDIQNPTNP